MIKLLKKLSFFRIALILCLVILILILAAGSFYKYKPLKPKSSVRISQTGGELTMSLSILPSDKVAFEEFLINLGIFDKGSRTFSFKSSNGSLQTVSWPLEASLDISPKRIDFFSPKVNLLKNSLEEKIYEFASGSAKVSFKNGGDQDYEVHISDPGNLLRSATASAQFFISKKLEGMFPILDKIAKIDLEILGKSLNGDVVLK